MKYGPDISKLAALIGDPARTNMLTMLMDGRAFTASELANEAGITKQAASSHLGKLVKSRLIEFVQQGRHRYFRLAHDDIGQLLEHLMVVAGRLGPTRMRVGPREPALRKARVCYDHLAGEYGVHMLDSMLQKKYLKENSGVLTLSAKGEKFCKELGVDIGASKSAVRPVCRYCLDWSMRRAHLAGGLGAFLLREIYGRAWARPISGTRIIQFSPEGEKAFFKLFPYVDR